MFKKNFFKLFSLALLIYPLSFINQILISYFFGTSAKLDAYWFSMSLAMVLIIHLQPVKEILVICRSEEDAIQIENLGFDVKNKAKNHKLKYIAAIGGTYLDNKLSIFSSLCIRTP